MDEYKKFVKEGIRTAYDLYLGFLTRDLLSDGSAKRTIKAPTVGTFGTSLEAATLQNVMVGILDHPNFEKIKQMRARAVTTAHEMFTTLVAATSTATPYNAPGGKEVPAVSRVATGTLRVIDSEEGLAVATAVLCQPRLAMTIDTLASGHTFLFEQSGLQRHGRLIQSRPDLLLALYELQDALDGPFLLAPQDVEPQAECLQFSYASGFTKGILTKGTVLDISADVRVASGPASSLVLRDVMLVDISGKPGSGGAPLVNAAGELVGISVAGSETHTVAVPISKVRDLLATRVSSTSRETQAASI